MFLSKKFTITEYLSYSGMLFNIREKLIYRETFAILCYFLVYMIFSFSSPEAEYLHWSSLVVLPFGILYYIQRKNLIAPSLKLSLAFFGLRKNNMTKGLLSASVIGILLSLVLVVAGGNINSVSEIVLSAEVLYLMPLAFILQLITVGFTEEFFFRGVIQTRMVRLVKSNFLGITITSILFGIFRIPYYYLALGNTGFNSWDPFFIFIFGEGVVAGFIIGYMYLKSSENLLSAVVLHSAMMILPSLFTIKMNWF